MNTQLSVASNYLVSFNTVSLEPIWIEHKLCTRVTENHAEFIVKMKPINIIKKSLLFYGTSYKHATFFSKEAIGNLHKVPIIVSHDFGHPLIMMPTLSPESDGNIWISFSAVDYYSQNSIGQCLVHFTNTKVIPVNVSYSTMCRQFVLCHFLTNHFQKTRQHIQQPYIQPKPTYLQSRVKPKQ